MFDKKRTGTGTREWSEFPYNIQKGCENGCIYCYARYNAIKRFKTVANIEEWRKPIINTKKIKKKWRKRDGVIMFPTQHDITPQNLSEACEAIENMLSSQNHVLIVSKPQILCVKQICQEFKNYKDLILFRFSIGSIDEEIIQVFEPYAPTALERMECLQYAYNEGFQTSVSDEPLLGGCQTAENLFQWTSSFITDTLWFGFLNKIDQRILEDTSSTFIGGKHIGYWKAYIQEQTNFKVASYCAALAYLSPKVRLKDSMVKCLQIDRYISSYQVYQYRY